jgi:hypothetical protein
MPDNKTKTSIVAIKTPLRPGEKSNDENTFRVKLLHADRGQSIGKHAPPEPPPPINTEPEPVTDGKAGKKSLFWAAGYGLLFAVLTVAAIHLFRSDPAPTTGAKVEDFNTGSNQAGKHARSKPPQVVLDRTIDIGAIVANINKDIIWDVHKIHFLKKNWTQLDSKRQWEVSREEWFKAFLAALDQQLNIPAKSTQLSKEQLIARSTALLDLKDLLTHAPPQKASPTVIQADVPEKVITNVEISQNSHNTDIQDKPAVKSKAELPGTQHIAAVKPPQDTEPQVPVPAITEPKKQSPTRNIPINKEAKPTSTQVETGIVAKVAINKDAKTSKHNNATPAAKPAKEPAKPAAPKSTETARAQTSIVESASQDPNPTSKPVKDTPREVVIEKKLPEKKKYYYVNGSIESLRENKPRGNITVSEINDLLYELSNSYERGDLKVFASLFNKDPNDENYKTLVKTEKKFEQWLSNTSDRQMFLKGFNWAFNKNVAIGSGTLSLTLFTDDDPRIVTIKKSVEIIVRKDEEKVSITKFEQSDI